MQCTSCCHGLGRQGGCQDWQADHRSAPLDHLTLLYFSTAFVAFVASAQRSTRHSLCARILAAGATNPLASDPGSIRGMYAIDVGRNIIHGSDSVESAKREIGLWFPEGLAEYKPHIGPWVYEKF